MGRRPGKGRDPEGGGEGWKRKTEGQKDPERNSERKRVRDRDRVRNCFMQAARRGVSWPRGSKQYIGPHELAIFVGHK